jgi:endonuclease-3
VSDPALPFSLPRVTPGAKSRARRLLRALDAHYPDAHCELRFSSPHELLVATILSAQATDAGVNKATPALFARYPTPADYARATPQEIEKDIRSIGLFRTKARAIHSAMKDITEKFGGSVPRTMEELLTLRGVARKTANVVLGNAFGIHAGIPVDTHVQRLSVRLGLVKPGATPGAIERTLMALFPRDRWCLAGHQIIFHGRYCCKARLPACADHPICREFGERCELRVTAPRRGANSTTQPTTTQPTTIKPTTPPRTGRGRRRA